MILRYLTCMEAMSRPREGASLQIRCRKAHARAMQRRGLQAAVKSATAASVHTHTHTPWLARLVSLPMSCTDDIRFGASFVSGAVTAVATASGYSLRTKPPPCGVHHAC